MLPVLSIVRPSVNWPAAGLKVISSSTCPAALAGMTPATNSTARMMAWNDRRMVRPEICIVISRIVSTDRTSPDTTAGSGGPPGVVGLHPATRCVADRCGWQYSALPSRAHSTNAPP